MWLKLRGTLPKLLAHFIQRKGQPTWDESMDKRNAEGVAARGDDKSAGVLPMDMGDKDDPHAPLLDAVARRD